MVSFRKSWGEVILAKKRIFFYLIIQLSDAILFLYTFFGLMNVAVGLFYKRTKIEHFRSAHALIISHM